MSLLLEGVAVSVSGTRVFKSKEPRGSRVVEALVVGTLGGVKPLHSLTLPSSLVRSAIFGTDVWLENIRYCLKKNLVYRIPILRKGTYGTFLIGQSAPFSIHPSPN